MFFAGLCPVILQILHMWQSEVWQESILLVCVQTWGQTQPLPPKRFYIVNWSTESGTGERDEGGRSGWLVHSCGRWGLVWGVLSLVLAHFSISPAPSVKECDDGAGRYFQVKADMVKNCPSYGGLNESSFHDAHFFVLFLFSFFSAGFQ